ncbi:MAG: N-acetyltransferase family protein [Nitrospirota bacterium]|jgi:ribosomal protein S18 acetylase RimI-like enzyme
MIAPLDGSAISDLREALPRFGHVPAAHLPDLTFEQRLAYWLDEISQSLADENSIAFGWLTSGRIGGFIVYSDSPWDSRIIGRRMGTVKHLGVASNDPAAPRIFRELITALMQTLVNRTTECVVCRVQSSELSAIHALEQSGFLLMDTLLDFVFDFSRTPMEKIRFPERDRQLKIRHAKAADLPILIEINEKSFGDYFGRYHADPQMPEGTATRIYTEWVRSAFQGWADWILVAELDNKIAGYGLWRKPRGAEERNSLKVAHYDLAAIDPEFRSRGLWTALMLDGMLIAREFARYLIGPVHVTNFPVQHLLQKFGWNTSGARHSFHKWLNQ